MKHPRTHYTYRCKICGHECIGKPGIASGLPVTKLGNYGMKGTPTPATYDVELYEATTISFTAETTTTPAKINDSAGKFSEKCFHGNMAIVIETTSGLNDGTYTVAARGGVKDDVLSLSSSDSLTTETAAAAGTVTLTWRTYKPNVTTGCPFCGSLNSR